jgi:hypothetical protein
MVDRMMGQTVTHITGKIPKKSVNGVFPVVPKVDTGRRRDGDGNGVGIGMRIVLLRSRKVRDGRDGNGLDDVKGRRARSRPRLRMVGVVGIDLVVLVNMAKGHLRRKKG